MNAVNELSSCISSFRGNSLKDPASKAYEQALAPYHGWAIRKAVSAGMYVLPTKEQLLKKLNEDGKSIINFACSFTETCMVNYAFMILIFLFLIVLLLATFGSEASAKVQMQIYASASEALIQYIDKLFVSRNLGTDW